MANIHMGYMGHCKIDGTQYLITGSSLNPVQTVEAPDLVQGWYMRKGWNYGKVEIGGNVTGPLHEYGTNLWPTAFNRNDDGDHLASGGLGDAVHALVPDPLQGHLQPHLDVPHAAPRHLDGQHAVRKVCRREGKRESACPGPRRRQRQGHEQRRPQRGAWQP